LQHVVPGGDSLNTSSLIVSPLSLFMQSITNVGRLECRDADAQPIMSSGGTIAGTAVVSTLKTPGNSGGTTTFYAFTALAMRATLLSACWFVERRRRS
jgi:hypothetical protein